MFSYWFVVFVKILPILKGIGYENNFTIKVFPWIAVNRRWGKKNTQFIYFNLSWRALVLLSIYLFLNHRSEVLETVYETGKQYSEHW